MSSIFELEKSIKEMIDELKGLCADNGLSNQAGEETVITTVFLYKFLNDKFMFNLNEFAAKRGWSLDRIRANENDELDMMYDKYSGDVAFAYEDTIEHLINSVQHDNFYAIFDDALVRISNYDRNKDFSIETDEGTKKPLFTKLSDVLTDTSKKNAFTRAIFGIISQDKFDFGGAFANNFDFYSTIFEYLIKDYNVASGKYAEYFTPQTISHVISKILVHMGKTEEDRLYEICDPSAGSGSLVLHLANELGHGAFGNNARVYTQDISNKSTRFLRINMMLNGLKESLNNIIEGNTMLNPAHFQIPGDQNSGLKKFDFITANPPFKVDFSNTRDEIEQKWEGTGRFFAGVPKIPNKKKDSMAIYLLFIQHIIYSLKDDGKAAIVVPTGFITAQSGIERAIREKMIEEKMLRGVISMPSNIFANTGTNVSVIFIDKSKTFDDNGNELERDVLLMDASNLGTKVKDGKNQRTILSDEETRKIIDTFVHEEVVEDFSIRVTNDQIREKNYSFSAGQYFDVKIEYVEITQEEYNKMVEDFNAAFAKYMEETMRFQENIKRQLVGLKINDKNKGD